MSENPDNNNLKNILEGNEKFDELSKLSQFSALLMDAANQLTSDFFIQVVLKYVEEGEYREAFRCAFSLKESSGKEEAPRNLIYDVISQFITKEKGALTGEQLKLLCDEVRIQYSYMRIHGISESIISKYSGLMNYLKSLAAERNTSSNNGKHNELFKYLEDLFLKSNSGQEAWDRVAFKIIGSK